MDSGTSLALVASLLCQTPPQPSGSQPPPAQSPPVKLLEPPRMAPVVIKDARTNYLRGVEEPKPDAQDPPPDAAAADGAQPPQGDPQTAAAAQPSMPPTDSSGLRMAPSQTASPGATAAGAQGGPAPAGKPFAIPPIAIAALAAIALIIGPVLAARWLVDRKMPSRAD